MGLTFLWKYGVVLLQHTEESYTISAKHFAYFISLLRNYDHIYWWCNEVIERHVCKLLVGLEKLKVEKML